MTTFLDYLLGGAANGAVIALIALALVLIWRSSRVVNFAQVGQAMITTFIALTVQQRTGSWLLALVVALLAGAVVGFLVYLLVRRPVQRLDTTGAIIATFGVLIALQAAAAMIWGGDLVAYPQPFPASGLEFAGRTWPISVYDLIVIGVAALLVVSLSLFLTRTSLGLGLRAAAFNPEVARLSGVRVSRMLALGWGLAGVVGALAGVLIAPISSLSPNSFDLLLILAFTAAVIGGLDSLVGAVTFGIGTGLLLSLVTGYASAEDAPLAALVLLALNLILKPGGFFAHAGRREV
jgi:branched-chain amino acid transport system permease protein